jgi:hypothetical protein
VILTSGMAIWTQADLDKLKAAVSSGVLSVDYEGPPKRSITYQSLGAMRELLASMVRQVSGATSFRHAAFSSGFNPPRGSGGEGGFDGGA